MSGDTKEAITAWFSEFVKNVGVPTAVCGVLLYMGNTQMITSNERAARAEERSEKLADATVTTLTTKLDESNAILRLLNESYRQSVLEQGKTQALMREVRDELNDRPGS